MALLSSPARSSAFCAPLSLSSLSTAGLPSTCCSMRFRPSTTDRASAQSRPRSNVRLCPCGIERFPSVTMDSSRAANSAARGRWGPQAGIQAERLASVAPCGRWTGRVWMRAGTQDGSAPAREDGSWSGPPVGEGYPGAPAEQGRQAPQTRVKARWARLPARPGTSGPRTFARISPSWALLLAVGGGDLRASRREPASPPAAGDAPAPLDAAEVTARSN